MLVVSDTSPLRSLQALGLVHVLEALYQSVVIPPAVMTELRVDVAGLGPFDPATFPFIRVQAPSAIPAAIALDAQLGPGEAAAIALALELRADKLLIDERRGRGVASKLGVPTTGVLSMLVDAKAAGLIPAVAPLLEKLHATIDFRMSHALRDRILSDAGER
ncbi:MAG TPA: DUF3368 domain-containing protein [Phycisphaerales bacterium]|nr:DUF3368 domain-containing protein [Phycisphaerales bacterium]